MSTRLTALFLAAALLWAGLVTHVQPASIVPMADGAAVLALAAAPGEAADGHALDGLPAPAHAEPLSDAPAVLSAPGEASAPALTMARPLPVRVAALTAPYLDGPQRPPCLATVTA